MVAGSGLVGRVGAGAGISAAPAMTKQKASMRPAICGAPAPIESWKTRMPPLGFCFSDACAAATAVALAEPERRYSADAVSTARCVALAFVLWPNLSWRATRGACEVTNQTHEPGRGRPRSHVALSTLKKEIARRIDHAQKEARKLRAASEKKGDPGRRRTDLP